MYRGMTLINDPRVSVEGFYKQMTNARPNVALTTGSLWEEFFRNVQKDLEKGKKVDLSYVKMWIIGGEGTNPEYFNKWKEIMKECNSEFPLLSGYGMSELFSVLSVETVSSSIDTTKKNKEVISVGIPYPGTNIKIVDKNGKELKYNELGELLVNSPTAMKGYYKKQELSDKVLADGWVHTGDIFSVDENGILYFYGRADDKVKISDKIEIQLFDIANIIRKDKNINDVFVNAMPLSDGTYSLVAHIIFNEKLNEFLPPNVVIDGYKEQLISFKCSPTTVKKDRKALMKELDGYIKVTEDGIYQLTFEPTDKETLIKNYKLETKKKK